MDLSCPFYFQCKCRSACERGSYSLRKDRVWTLKQMEDLLNSLLGVWMHFILISLLDGNVFFKSDKEPGKQRPECFSSGRPGGLAGSALPSSLAKFIRKQASVREAGGWKSHPARCLEAEMLTWSWTEVYRRKASPPLSLSPPKGLWTPLTLLISCPFPEREPRTVQAAGGTWWNYSCFFF